MSVSQWQAYWMWSQLQTLGFPSFVDTALASLGHGPATSPNCQKTMPLVRSSLTLVPTADSESALWPNCSPHLTIVHSQPCLPWDPVMPVRCLISGSQTSVLTVNPEIALWPAPPPLYWSLRLSSACPGANPGTWEDLAGATFICVPGNRPACHAPVASAAAISPCSSPTQLIPEAISVGESLYLLTSAYKDVCSFKCTDINVRLHGSWKNQANVTAPKETNKALVTDPKETEVAFGPFG